MASAAEVPDAPPPALRALLAVAFGAVALLAALAASLLAGAEGARRLETEIARDLRGLASHVADTLDRLMFERWREIQIAAALPTMRDPATSVGTRREVLARLAETYPDYALIAFIDPELRVVADTRGALEGIDASGWDFVRAARERPVITDVHEAAMPARVPEAPAASEPARLVDVAAPVRGPDGALVGIVAARLHWDWTRGVENAFRDAGGGERRGLEVTVLSRKGEVLLGPPGLLGHVVPPAAGGAIAWPDAAGRGARTWLTGIAPTRGHRDYPGLAWSVALRQDAALALAPVAALQRRVLLWGTVAALAAALLGWLAAGWIAQPLRALTGAAERLRHAAGQAAAGDAAAALFRTGSARGARRYHEAEALRTALAALVENWQRTDGERETARAAVAKGEARLRAAQEGGRVAAFVHDVAANAFEADAQLRALWGLAPDAPLDLATMLARVHPLDRARVQANQQRLLAGGGRWETEFRVPLPNGSVRWLAVRGEAQTGPDGSVTRLAGVTMDVTARKEAELRLADSEARLGLVQRAGQVGGYDWDLVTNRCLRSASFAAILRMPAPTAETPWEEGQAAWIERIHPDDRSRMAAEIAALAGRTGPYELEYRLLRPDGTTCWVADRGEVLDGPDGRPARVIGAIRDITRRVEDEAALRASEERLRLAQQAGGIGAWELRIAEGTRHWSVGTYRLWGIDPAETPTIELITATIHPEDRRLVHQAIAEAATRLGPFREIEFRIHRRSDGALRWLRSSGETLPGPNGAPSRQLGIMRDVTEQKRIEAALREREAQLARVQRVGRIGGFEIDLAEGALRYRLSPEYLRLHGLSPEAEHEPHEAWVRRIHAEDRDRADRAFHAAIAGDAPDYAAEYRIVAPGGDTRWISAVAEIERDGQGRPLRMVGAHRDVTALKAAEEALREANEALERRVAERTAELVASEAELSRIYDRTPAAFHSIDAEGRITRVSGFWLDFLGYPPEEVLGRRVSEFMPPASAARWEAVFAGPAATPGASREFEYRMLRRDGSEVEVLLRTRPEMDAAGRFLRSYTVLLDMTERNRAEARLREAQKLEALGRVAGGVAHDFNNLLQVVTGALRLIEGHADRPERVRRYTAAALEAADRGASLTRRMLTFARREDLRADMIDPGAQLEGLVGLLRGSLGPLVRVAVDLAPGLPAVRTDRAQLDLVLFNLALNARDAMPDGGTLTLFAGAETVDEEQPGSGLAAGRYLRLGVRDSGRGMDAATLARATEPFFTTKEVGQGTGLGLSMAHGFAEQSGGRLSIESAPGRGTTVALWLPVPSPDAMMGSDDARVTALASSPQSRTDGPLRSRDQLHSRASAAVSSAGS